MAGIFRSKWQRHVRRDSAVILCVTRLILGRPIDGGVIRFKGLFGVCSQSLDIDFVDYLSSSGKSAVYLRSHGVANHHQGHLNFSLVVRDRGSTHFVAEPTCF